MRQRPVGGRVEPGPRERLGHSVAVLRHTGFFLRQSLRGLLRPHRLKLSPEPIAAQEAFVAEEVGCRSFQQVFGLEQPDWRVPFSYFWPVAVRALFGALTTLEINYRKILHLKEERRFVLEGGLRAGERYVVDSSVDDILHLPPGRAALLVASEVKDAAGAPTMQLRDWILVKGVPALDLERLSLDPRFNHAPSDDLQGLSRLRSRFADPARPQRRLSFEVPANVGRRYGIVSGDLNFIHTFRALARAFGYPDKFVQGGYTANWLLKAFVHDCDERLEFLSVRFCRPIFVGQTVELCFDEREFEILDPTNAVLAGGERRRRPLVTPPALGV